MLSTNYDVVLSKPGTGSRITMGIIGEPIITDFPSLSFKTNAYKLSKDNKAMLATIAAKIKAVPTATIVVHAYPTGTGIQYMYNKRLENIKVYLVEKEGVSADRIRTICEVGAGDKNTVDIKSDN